jgi:hypothetical protein
MRYELTDNLLQSGYGCALMSPRPNPHFSHQNVQVLSAVKSGPATKASLPLI